MSFIKEGWQELQRKLQRQKNRVLLEAKKKRLSEAEIRLGSLRADEVHEIESLRGPARDVRLLCAKEREQQELLDETQKHLDAEKALLDESRKNHESAVRQLQEERTPLNEERNICKGKLRAFEAEVTECQRKLKALQNEKARSKPANKKKKKSRDAAGEGEETPPEALGEVSWETNHASEQKEIEEALEQASSRLEPLQEELAGLDQRLKKLDERIAKANADWHQHEKAQSHTITAREQRVRSLKDELLKIEKQRAEPFRQIGRYVAAHPELAGDRQKELETTLKLQEEVRVTERENQRLANESASINRQSVRKFYFVIVSLATVIGVGFLLVARPETPSVYLPAATEALLSINFDELPEESVDLESEHGSTKLKLLREHLDELSTTAHQFGLPTKTGTLTLAIPSDTDPEALAVPWRLIQFPDADGRETLEWISRAKGVRSNLSGIIMVEQNNRAVAAVGPGMYAFGQPDDVKVLAGSRLGLSPDLRVEAPPLDVFSQLSSRFDFRAATTANSLLANQWNSALNKHWFEHGEAVAVGVAFNDGDARVRFVLGADHLEAAEAFVAAFEAAPQNYLTLNKHERPLFLEAPKVKRHGRQVEVQFDTDEARAIDLIEALSALPPGTASSDATTSTGLSGQHPATI